MSAEAATDFCADVDFGFARILAAFDATAFEVCSFFAITKFSSGLMIPIYPDIRGKVQQHIVSVGGSRRIQLMACSAISGLRPLLASASGRLSRTCSRNTTCQPSGGSSLRKRS